MLITWRTIQPYGRDDGKEDGTGDNMYESYNIISSYKGKASRYISKRDKGYRHEHSGETIDLAISNHRRKYRNIHLYNFVPCKPLTSSTGAWVASGCQLLRKYRQSEKDENKRLEEQKRKKIREQCCHGFFFLLSEKTEPRAVVGGLREWVGGRRLVNSRWYS